MPQSPTPSDHDLRVDIRYLGADAVAPVDPADAEQLERLGRDLAGELGQLDALTAVEPLPPTAPPAGAKGFDPSWGTLLIRFAEVGGVASLAAVLAAWLGRDRRRSLRLELGGDVLEVHGLDAAERERLTHWFRQRSEARSGGEG